MPCINIVKSYVAGGFYHVYNRGVDRQLIFHDDRDYRMFLHCLDRHLGNEIISDEAGRPYKKLNNHVRLHAYCLMPNHFHLLVEQVSDLGMEMLMRRIMTSYSIYFNRRHNRVGGLFQGTYRAVLAGNDEQLLWVSRYIHENPREICRGHLEDYSYSSLGLYFGKRLHRPDWITTSYIVSLLDGRGGYEDFMDVNLRQGYSLQGVTL